VSLGSEVLTLPKEAYQQLFFDETLRELVVVDTIGDKIRLARRPIAPDPHLSSSVASSPRAAVPLECECASLSDCVEWSALI